MPQRTSLANKAQGFRALGQFTLALAVLLLTSCSDASDQQQKRDQTKDHLLQQQEDALNKAKDAAEKLEDALEQRAPK